VTSIVPLDIRPSSIAGAKHGLFTSAAIGEGEEIFRSDPLITCVSDGIQTIVCDYCLSYSRSAILPSGHFRQTWEGMEPFKRCGRCHACYYCSKVGPLSDPDSEKPADSC
jgi:SET and MYND domain-containing protein